MAASTRANTPRSYRRRCVSVIAVGESGSPGFNLRLRSITLSLVTLFPLTSTCRTNCCLPSWMVKARSTRLGRAAGVELHSNVALGKPPSKYFARMVSRSTATLKSLKGWPATELSPSRMAALSRCSMPSTFRLSMKYCGPSSIMMKTAMSPALPR